MEGKIIRISRVNNGVMFLVWFKGREYGRTYTGEKYRNYELWKDLKVGDKIDGLSWKDKTRSIIDADSPVYPV
jgi:hypothetical protein